MDSEQSPCTKDTTARRVEAHVHASLRRIFRGRMTVAMGPVDVEGNGLCFDVHVTMDRYRGTAVDDMFEAVSEDDLKLDLDECRLCLHELVSLVPVPQIAWPEGPGNFRPMPLEHAMSLISLINRARELL